MTLTNDWLRVDFYGLLLVVAIIVRILLDFTSAIRASHVFDACYAVLLLAVGLVGFVMSGQALTASVSVVLGIGCSFLGLYRYKKRHKNLL